jgi:RraA family protein
MQGASGTEAGSIGLLEGDRIVFAGRRNVAVLLGLHHRARGRRRAYAGNGGDVDPKENRMDPATAPNKPKSAEINPGPGFRIKSSFQRLDAEFMRRFAEFESADISDQLNRLYAVAPAVHCLTGEHKLVGPACTVKVFPGDNLMVHKALDIARPGDVVVVDAGASRTNAALGGLISTKATHRGLAGFVVDGYIRDLPEILPLDFPVFARGTTPIGPLHRGPGEINYPICCGGVVVNPGDIVVADGFGVVIIPRENAPEIHERLMAFQQKNRDYFAGVKAGLFSNQWVDDVLDESGCITAP